MSRRLLPVSTRATLIALVAGAFALTISPPASAATVATVSAGYDHTCAVTSSGVVRCWGANGYGQLGNGTTTPSLTPVNVSGLPTGVVAVSTGVHDSCALTTSGGVWCWGVNTSGQLGNGTTTNSSLPVTPVGLESGVRSISVGYAHACALMTDGTVQCWGANGHGSLGNGTRTTSLVPAPVAGLSGILSISSGGVHTCVLTDEGAVKCWGFNAYGQVGNGTSGPAPDSDVLSPADVVGLSSSVTALASGGYHSCALLAAGAAVCWGQNIAGELGNGTTVNSNVPVSVAGPTGGFASLAPGAYHTCAITPQGGAMCWGDGDVGSLGNGGTSDRSVPTAVVGASSGTASLAAGRVHTCRVDTSGRTTCWGGNLFGQVGNGTTSVAVTTPVPVAWFSAGFTISCSGLECRFTDASGDPDGEIVSRTWAFGDGASASGTTVSRTYATGGTYPVVLTARDAAGATSEARMNVTVTPWNLRASVSKVRNVSTVSLTWNAAATSVSTVDVVLNGVVLTNVSNTGSFSHAASKGSLIYRVCPAGDARCSNQVSVKV